jgi:uncharacterized protein (TIGR02145 family)
MRQHVFFLMLVLVMISAASVNGRVLIGGSETDEPHGGAILDLASGRQNNLGLLLPNVQLTGEASEFVLVPTAEDPEKQAATGMLVYNTSYFLKGPGLYVWNGASWMPLRDPCRQSIIDDRDGNWYCTGDFGAAGTWMTQNLRYIPKEADGYFENDALANNGEKYYTYPGTGDAATRKAAWEDHEVYGLLYNWYAASGRPGTTNDNEGNADYDEIYQPIQGICPTDWHLPSDKEWSDLEKAIAADTWNESFWTAINYRGTTHGAKMKSQTYINDINPQGSSNIAAVGGFDVMLVGRVHSESNNYFGALASFWSSSSSDSDAWHRYLDTGHSGVNRSYSSRAGLFSLRCKKDN